MLRALAHSTLATLVVLLAACSDSTAPTPADVRPALAVGGRHACVVADSATRCWGKGTDGQLGIGVTPVDTTPVIVAGAPPLVSLVAGTVHTCGLDSEGNAYCWGSNRDGQLGTLDQVEVCPLPCATTPRPVAGGLRFQVLATGTDHTCGITPEGSAYCWGLNDIGQLGTTAASESCVDGPCSRVPIRVQTDRTFRAVTAGIYHTCALDPAGVAFCWGFQLGTTEKVHPHPQFKPEVTAMPGGLAFHQISAGGWHTCGVTSAGAAYCWGIDAIGAGPSPLESDEPVAVGGGHRFKAVYSAGSTSCGLDQGGVAYCWGPNSDGAVGTEPTGSTIRFNLPTPVSGGLRFTTLAPGQGTYCGITTAETIACWGRGTSGELGVGHQDSSQPVTVPAL
jgi:alpha-tubulin suppressor-like RCC1 family protein